MKRHQEKGKQVLNFQNNNYRKNNDYQNRDRSVGIPPFKNKVIMCNNCNKPGHMARNCVNRPRVAAQANLTEDQLIAMVSSLNIIDKQHVRMISEVNFVGGSEGWWIE